MKKVIFIISFISLILLVLFFLKYPNHLVSRNSQLDLNKIRNLELKGNYYFKYKMSGEPLDIIHIFYSEYDFYNTDTFRDSTFRLWKIVNHPFEWGNSFTVSVFEFGKVGDEYIPYRYQLSLTLVEPYYYIINVMSRALTPKKDINSFKDNFYSKEIYDFHNMEISKDENGAEVQGSSTNYIEFRTQNEYTRIRIPEKFSLSDKTSDGNRKLIWLFDNVEKEFGFDLRTGNEIVK